MRTAGMTDRVTRLNQNGEATGDFVLYWMQQSQRAVWNQALEYAVEQANDLDLPLVVCFGLTSYPDANLRHYTFMLEGLKETAAALKKRNIQFVVRLGDPAEVALEIGQAGGADRLRPRISARSETVAPPAGGRGEMSGRAGGMRHHRPGRRRLGKTGVRRPHPAPESDEASSKIISSHRPPRS